MDVKIQAYRGDSGPDKVDFRESAGEFLGSPEDEHKTLIEFRVDETRLPDGLTLDEVIGLAAKANEFFALFTSEEPALIGTILTDLGVAGIGPIKLAIRVYDND